MTKPTLLIVAPQNPYPAVDGGKIGIYAPIMHLTHFYEIHFAFISSSALPRSTFDHFDSLGVNIYPQYLHTVDTPFGYLKNFFQKLPFKFQKYCSSDVLENLSSIVKDQAIKFVWCNHSHVAWYGVELKKKFKLQIFLREHNIEYSLVNQALKLQSNFIIKSLIKYQFQKTQRFETDCWQKFDLTFFISDSDYKQAVDKTGSNRKYALVYDSFYHNNLVVDNVSDKEPFSFIFTGNIGTLQNRVNLRRFIEEIWQPLQQKDTRFHLYITGNNAEDLEKQLKINLKNLNITSLGFVDNIEEVILSKKFFVSPTYIGSGIRIKVLNALSMGAVCLVSQLDHDMCYLLKDYYNLMKYDDFDEFYSKLARLESDDNLYELISVNAKKVGTTFTWEYYAEKVNNEITKASGFTSR